MPPVTLNRKVDVDDSGDNLSGTIHNNAWLQDLQDRIDAALASVGGVWADVPFVAGNFFVAQGTGTWTVTVSNQATYCWARLTNSTVLLCIYIGSSVMTAGVVSLGVTLPAAVPTPTRTMGTPYHFYGSANNGMGLIIVDGGSRRLRLLRDIAGTPFNADTNFYTVGQVIIPY